jgi:hypothetical protein
MSNKKFEFDLEGIDYSKLNTEADFKREAKRLLPECMKVAGGKVAETFWKATQKALDLTNSQKSEFIREAEDEFANLPKEKKRIEKLLISKLKEGKQKQSSIE